MENCPVIRVTAFTHQGRVRQTNEDTIAIGPWVRNKPMLTPHQWRFALEAPHLCIVADGMGGHAAGERASKHVASRLSDQASTIEDAESLDQLLQKVNAELYDQMQKEHLYVGMGTTVVGILLFPDRLLWFNIGDSRLYRFQNSFLRQISIDDVPPPVPGLSVAGSRRPTSTITQSLGGTRAMQRLVPHVGIEELPTPSRWLLCSDGLTDMVSIDAMEECLELPALDAVSNLARYAIENGGSDNISVVLMDIKNSIASS